MSHNTGKPTIFLFDIDSVLVKPGGYRHAFWASFNYFTELSGIKVNMPTEEDLEFLESQGVTSEWDMLPICLAMTLDKVFALEPSLNKHEELHSLFLDISYQDLPEFSLDYRSFFKSLKSYIFPDIAPSDSLIKNYRSCDGESIFPNIKNSAILDLIFDHSRDVTESFTTRVFQNFILGHKNLKKIYSIIELFECEPMLMQYDRPLLDNDTRDRLICYKDENRLKLSVYTLRPSYPPREIEEQMYGYAPETEMAISLLGFSDIPVISYGRLLYLSNLYHLRVEDLIKPSPVQALSAIAAAWTGKELLSLEWAYQTCEKKILTGMEDYRNYQSELPKALSLHVFEDSASGMRSAIEAGNILREIGIDVDQYLWGITPNPDKKIALEALGAKVFDHINQAVSAALKDE